MSNVIDNIFGGGKPDNSASDVAQAELQAQREAAAQEQARWQKEQDRIAADKADAAAKAAADEAARQKALDDAKVENQKQIEAQKATGQGISFDQTMAAKKLAAADAGGIPLPNYSSLSKFAATTPGGYQGQQNQIVSPTGFNTSQVGGRRYS